MSEIWVACDSVYDLMRRVMASCHPHIAGTDAEIVILMREKAIKSGGVLCRGTVKKASNVLDKIVRHVNDDVGVKFVMEIAGDEWNIYDDNQREALMDHLLCMIHIEYDEKTGEIKYGIKKPEIQMFKAEIRRRGVWMDVSEENDGFSDVVTVVNKISEEPDEDSTEIKSM